LASDDEYEPDPVEVPIEEAIDLHTFAPRDIPAVVEAYIEAAVERGFREVRLIHGKGKGVQRRAVRELLRNHRLVEEFFDAPPGFGTWGATIARLRPPEA
jgi:DNA-nicking Smr family endonuclease